MCAAIALLFTPHVALAAEGALPTAPEKALARLSAAAGVNVKLGDELVDSPFHHGADPRWQVEAGEASFQDGAFIVKHTPSADPKFLPKHANHILTRPFGDVLIRFSFQLRTASRIGFIVDDLNGQHSGYFSIKPKLINLPEKEAPKRANPNYQEAPVELARDRTYTAWIALKGSKMIATIDEGKVLVGHRDNLTLEKSRLKLEVYDGIVAVRDFKMWTIKPTAVKPWRLAQREGRYHLLTPDEKPFMILGISHVSLALAETAAQPLDAPERGRREARLLDDLREMRFNTVAVGFDTWGQPVAEPETWRTGSVGFLKRMAPERPFIAGMDRFVGYESLPAFGSKDAASRFEDVFDPAFKKRLREKARILCELCRDSSNCIGYWWSDIPPWGLEGAKTRFGKNWVDFIRELPETAPGKQRYAEFLRASGAHDDRAFLRLIARELYTELAAAFREYDPKRLLFGERYGGQNAVPEVLEEAAKFVDVISIQPAGDTFKAELFDAVHARTKKPIIISDWNLSYPTPEHAVTMWTQFKTPAEAAVAYEAYLKAAFSKPYFIGYFKCQYVDQPLATGMLKQGLRTPGGTLREEFARALQGIHDRLIPQLEREGRLENSNATISSKASSGRRGNGETTRQ